MESQEAVWETRNVLCRSFGHLQRATRALKALMMSCIVTCRSSKATQKLLMRFVARRRRWGTL